MPNNKITSWSIAMLEKLVVPQLAKKFPAFFSQLEDSLSCLKHPDI